MTESGYAARMNTTEMTKRDAKLGQYLNEAYATERRLEIGRQGGSDGGPARGRGRPGSAARGAWHG